MEATFTTPETLVIKVFADTTDFEAVYNRIIVNGRYEIRETITWTPFANTGGLQISDKILAFEEAYDGYCLSLASWFVSQRIAIKSEHVEQFAIERIRSAIKMVHEREMALCKH